MRLSAQINAMLCVSRFAHYVKIIGRELTGAFLTAGEIERRLQIWLAGYTNASLMPGPDSRARHPLVSSRVRVHELPAGPVRIGCVDPTAALLPARRRLGDLPPGHRLSFEKQSARESASRLTGTHSSQENSMPTKAGDLFRQGDLAEAVEAADAAVRGAPRTRGPRAAGRAAALRRQLSSAPMRCWTRRARSIPSAALVVGEFRQLLRAATARRQVLQRRTRAGVPG